MSTNTSPKQMEIKSDSLMLQQRVSLMKKEPGNTGIYTSFSHF
jgi:hypothetical protein